MDVSCNSTFIRQMMPKAGKAIHQQMPWIPQGQPVYLQMDNAGGHGTKATICEYKTLLLEQYNVILLYQGLHSPEMNALNLGLWRSLQSEVEKLHRDKRTDANAIANSVQQAWNHLPSEKIARVFSRIPIVLELIVEDQGGNDLIEGHRGQLNHAP
jgi:hypothetical protein